MNRRFFAILLISVLLMMTVAPLPAMAATGPSLSGASYAAGYTVNAVTIPVYTDVSLSKRGTHWPYKAYAAEIWSTDEIRLYGLGSNYAWVGYYSSSRGWIEGFIRLSDLLPTNLTLAQTKYTGTANLTTYKRPGAASYGYIERNDDVWLYGSSGSYYAVIYTARSGNRGYKLGYITEANKKVLFPSSSPQPVQPTAAYTSLANGTYYLTSAVTSAKNMVLDVEGASQKTNGTLCIWPNEGNAHQKFKLTKQSNGSYIIQPSHSGLYLQPAANSTLGGTSVVQYTRSGSSTQQWMLYSAGNGYYYIKNVHSNKFLDVWDGSNANGTRVWQYVFNGSNAQKWKITTGIVTPTPAPVPSGLPLFPLKGSITRSSSVTTNGVYCDYYTGGSLNVYAPADGTCVFKQAYTVINGVRTLTSYGNWIEFKSSDSKYTIKLAHLNSFDGVGLSIASSQTKKQSGGTSIVLTTKTVKRGDLLGKSGMTGNASGHHLHIEVTKDGKTVAPASTFQTW